VCSYSVDIGHDFVEGVRRVLHNELIGVPPASKILVIPPVLINTLRQHFKKMLVWDLLPGHLTVQVLLKG
jgi:hypothetical protein